MLIIRKYTRGEKNNRVYTRFLVNILFARNRNDCFFDVRVFSTEKKRTPHSFQTSFRWNARIRLRKREQSFDRKNKIVSISVRKRGKKIN